MQPASCIVTWKIIIIIIIIIIGTYCEQNMARGRHKMNEERFVWMSP